MICLTCQNTQFYEGVTGDMCCSACHTQSQDYVAECFEDDKMDPNRVIRAPRVYKLKIAKAQPVKIGLEDFLRVYQFCFKLLAETAAKLCKVNNEAIFVEKLKLYWFQYLHTWSTCGVSMESAFSSRESHLQNKDYDWISDDDECNDRHPLYPSRPLLLGFLYLGCRMLRLHIVPADIVRWIISGTVQCMSRLNRQYN